MSYCFGCTSPWGAEDCTDAVLAPASVQNHSEARYQPCSGQPGLATQFLKHSDCTFRCEFWCQFTVRSDGRVSGKRCVQLRVQHGGEWPFGWILFDFWMLKLCPRLLPAQRPEKVGYLDGRT